MSNETSRTRGLYSVQILPRAEKDLRRVSFQERRRLVAAVDRLAKNPRSTQTKKLSGGDNQYRLRAGKYRILYTIDDEHRKVTVYALGHRQGVY